MVIVFDFPVIVFSFDFHAPVCSDCQGLIRLVRAIDFHVPECLDFWWLIRLVRNPLAFTCRYVRTFDVCFAFYAFQ